MRLYHFTTAQYGLENLQKQRLKIARLMELNDPFEFLIPELSDKEKRRGLIQVKRTLAEKFGLLCFCRSWRNPVFWGHYAEKHGGLCIGFDVDDSLVSPVHYITARTPWPAQIGESFVKDLLFTKFVHWSYEEEYRAYVTLEDQERGLYFANFASAMKLRQVIIGPQSKVSVSEVHEALGTKHEDIEIIKARPAFRSFKVVRDKRFR